MRWRWGGDWEGMGWRWGGDGWGWGGDGLEMGWRWVGMGWGWGGDGVETGGRDGLGGKILGKVGEIVVGLRKIATFASPNRKFL